MMKLELEQKLASLNTEIQQANKEIKSLDQEKTSVVDRGDIDTPGYAAAPGSSAAEQLATIRERQAELQGRLEDLTIMRTALQGKLAVYKANGPKAAAIRKRITSELWPKAVKSYDELRKKLADAVKTLDELHQLNVTMGELAKQHELLAGEATVPRWVAISIDPLLEGPIRMGANLSSISKTVDLKVPSQNSRVKETKKTKSTKTTADVGSGYEDPTRYGGGREALHKPEIGTFEDLTKQPGVNINSTAVVDPTDPRTVKR